MAALLLRSGCSCAIRHAGTRFEFEARTCDWELCQLCRTLWPIPSHGQLVVTVGAFYERLDTPHSEIRRGRLAAPLLNHICSSSFFLIAPGSHRYLC